MADQTKLNWQSETFDLTTNLARLPIPSHIPDQTQSTTPAAARLESSSHPMYRSVPVSSKFANHTIYKASMLIRTHSRRRLVLSATHSHPPTLCPSTTTTLHAVSFNGPAVFSQSVFILAQCQDHMHSYRNNIIRCTLLHNNPSFYSPQQFARELPIILYSYIDNTFVALLGRGASHQHTQCLIVSPLLTD